MGSCGGALLCLVAMTAGLACSGSPPAQAEAPGATMIEHAPALEGMRAARPIQNSAPANVPEPAMPVAPAMPAVPAAPAMPATPAIPAPSNVVPTACDLHWPVSGPFAAHYGPSPYVHADGEGNVLFADTITGAIEFGDPAGTLTAVGHSDGVVAKLGGSCAIAWTHQLRGGDADSEVVVAGVSSDAESNVLLVGAVMGTVDLGAGPVATGPDGAWFLLKLDRAGDYQWSGLFGVWPPRMPTLLEGGDGGRILLGGFTYGTTDLGQATQGCVTDESRCYATTMIELDADGRETWRLTWGPQMLPHAQYTDDGSIVLSGGLTYPWSNSGLNLQDTNWVAKVGPDRELLATYNIDDGGTSTRVNDPNLVDDRNSDWRWNRTLALSALGDVFYLGTTVQSEERNPWSGLGTEPVVWWLAKVDAAFGAGAWPGPTQAGARGVFRQGRPAGIAVDHDGNALIAGDFAGEASFAGAPLTSHGQRDLFLIKLDPSGELVSAVREGSDEGDWAGSITVDANNGVWLAGWSGSLPSVPAQGDWDPPVPALRTSVSLTRRPP